MPKLRVMPRETTAKKTARIKKIIAALRKAYPDVRCELNHSNPLELLISTILSAQCTDERVNIVTKEGSDKYGGRIEFQSSQLNESPYHGVDALALD